MQYNAALIFDFDGTLVDSVPPTRAATNRVLEAAGISPVSEAEILEGMRYETPRRMGFHSGITDPAQMEYMAEQFFLMIPQVIGDYTVHQGFTDLIRHYRSRGIGTAIVSNNRSSVVRAVLTHLGIMDLFEDVLGEEDGIPVKPAPDGIQAMITRLGVPTPQRAAYIGDSMSDAVAARIAGVYSVGLRWVHDLYGVPPCDGFPRITVDESALRETLDSWMRSLDEM